MVLACSVVNCSSRVTDSNYVNLMALRLFSDAEIREQEIFTLHRFPGEKTFPEERIKWSILINRMDGDTLWKPKEYSRICSKHFKDYEPTLKNPYPTEKLGYDFKGVPKSWMERHKTTETVPVKKTSMRRVRAYALLKHTPELKTTQTVKKTYTRERRVYNANVLLKQTPEFKTTQTVEKTSVTKRKVYIARLKQTPELKTTQTVKKTYTRKRRVYNANVLLKRNPELKTNCQNSSLERGKVKQKLPPDITSADNRRKFQSKQWPPKVSFLKKYRTQSDKPCPKKFLLLQNDTQIPTKSLEIKLFSVQNHPTKPLKIEELVFSPGSGEAAQERVSPANDRC